MAGPEKSRTSNQPQNTAFKQQRLPAWQPVLTAWNVLPTFLLVGFLFIPLGVVLLVTSNNCFEKQISYTNCQNSQGTECYSVIKSQLEVSPPQVTDCQCEIDFSLDKDLEGTVYLYYKLTNFFQNHRVYVKSRDNSQLSGKTGQSVSDLDQNCEPYRSVEVNGQQVPIAPCGTIANSMFNDTFTVTNSSTNPIIINKKGIAWSTDHNIKFQNPSYDQCAKDDLKCNFGATNQSGVVQTAKPVFWGQPVYELPPTDQGPDYTGYKNEPLEVWMRTAAFPTFRKLYGKIEDGLVAGDYKIKIDYNYPTKGFSGEKYFVITQMTWAGGKNPFLGIAYIVVGSLSLIAAAVLWVIHMQSKKSGNER